jgi:hypothetical protein
MATPEDKRAIKALTPKRANEPLRERVRKRSLDRRAHDPEPLGAEYLIEADHVLRITIADEEAEGQLSHSATRLRACWLTQEVTGLGVTPAK